MKPFPGTGSLAEYVTVSAGYGVTHVPAGLDIKDAGALGLAGTAAFDSLSALNVSKGVQARPQVSAATREKRLRASLRRGVAGAVWPVRCVRSGRGASFAPRSSGAAAVQASTSPSD
ncbi:hypothetical protein [Streptomyces exfoliatus]|uniref:hypothetical protein n=1 Tax=Streptomyces exfoliatus TaxID=1905 RepID=UPI003C2D7F83